ncbi:hypothetical protein HHE01_04660 [Helicobacter heilmannii]|uniref:Uncharacterized protein n=2 Tax=Helicobacter heilmannii TaxID=35817 RepID=A0A0K2YCG4_HELHE|nr:outer membrane protein [Helicobacter heilmannii]CRI34665.1 hypothetical protein HHE01_04660 [Helicobacter heilmannii]
MVLVTCFGFVPSLGAEQVDVTSMVNSISGLLGGNYGLTDSGTFVPTITQQNFGSSTNQQGVTNPAGNQPVFGNGTLNDPYQSMGLSATAPTASNIINNLYGNGGLLNQYIGTVGDIYNFGSVNPLLSNISGNAYGAYGARTAFGGVSAANNITVPGTAVSNNYFQFVSGTQNSAGHLTQTAQVKGNLQSSQIATGSTASAANQLLGTIYTNITNLASSVNVVDPGTTGANNAFNTYSADMQQAIGTASGVGANFVSAMATPTGTLGTALSSLNTILGNGQSLISGSATGGSGNIANFSVNSANLNTLATINNIASLIPGGIVTQSNNTYSINANYATVLTELKGMDQALDVIANNVLNTPLSDVVSPTSSTITAMGTLNQVLTQLTAEAAAEGGSLTMAQVQSVVEGYINPNTGTSSITSPTHVNSTRITNGFSAVYNAFTILTNDGALTKIQQALTPSGGTAPTLAQTVVDMITLSNELSTAQSGVTHNSNLANLFTPGSLPTGTLSANQLSGLTSLYNAFGTDNSNAAYSTLTSALQKLSGLVNTGAITTTPAITSSNVSTTSTSSPFTANTDSTTLYPQAATSPSTSATQTTSWVQQRVLNQAAYNTAYNKNLATLLQEAMNYSANTQQLQGMLNTTSNTSLLSNILDTGISNAAANIMFNGGATEQAGKADAKNAQAQDINNIQAIFNSENLLNSYINAITKSYSTTTEQMNQASALTYLSGLLNAGQAQNGLIAQTKAAIIAQLNANPTLSSQLSKADLSSLEGMSNPSFTQNFLNGSLSASQFASAATSLNMIYNDLAAANTATAATAATAFGTVGNALTMAGHIALDLQALSAVDQTELANSISTLIKTPAALNTLAGGGNLTWASLTTAQQAALENLLGVANGTTSITVANSLVHKLSGLFNVSNTALSGVTNITTGTNNGVTNITAFLNLAKELYDAGNTFLSVYPRFNSPSIGTALGGSSDLAKGLVWFMQNSATITKDIGSLSPSVVSQFESGKLTAQDLSTQIATIKQEIAGLQSLGTGSQGAQSGTAQLDIGLSGLLGSGVSAAQNLGFAQASVNTMYNQLKGILPLLDTPNGQVSTTTLSDISSAISSLNSAVGALHTAGSQFFAGTGANTYNLTSTSNMTNTTTITGATIGLGDAQYSNSNAATYLTNLNNIYTMSNLLGDGFATSSAMGTAYQTLFGNANTRSGLLNNSSNITNTSATLSADISTLTTASNLQSGVTLTEVVNALMPIQAQLSSGQIQQSQANTAATVALANLASSSANATSIWQAYQSVMGFGNPTGSGTVTTNYVANINNLLNNSGLNPAKQANLTSASSIARVIQDAQNLINANNTLTSSTGITGAGGTGSTKYLTMNNALSTQNNGAAFSAAIKAADAFGSLLQYIKASDLGSSTVASATSVIRALNSYNHNLTLLNNLTDQQGSKVATDVLDYLQGAQSYKNLTLTSPSNGSLTGLNTLQNLVNRLEYLEGVASKVQDAVTNNPYAIVMAQSQVVKSNNYQSAAKALVTTGNTEATQGLFNLATSSTLNPGNASEVNISSSALSSLNTQFTSDVASISAWNDLGLNLNTSKSILQDPATGDTVPMTSLSGIASSVYGLTGFVSSGGSGTLSNTQTAVDNMLSAYNTINEQGKALTAGAFELSNTSSNNSVSIGTTTALTASMLTDPNLVTQPTPAGPQLTLLGAMQSIVNISSMLQPATSASNGLTGNSTNITAVTNALNNGQLNGDAGQIAAVVKNFTTPLYFSTNAQGQTTFSTTNTAGAATLNLNTLNNITTAGAVPLLTQLVEAIENNPNANAVLVAVKGGATPDLAQLVTLEKALQPVLGGTVGTNPGTGSDLTGGAGNMTYLNTATNAKSFLEAVQTFVGGSGALQAIDKVLRNNHQAAINSNVGQNIGKALKNALTLANDFADANAVIKTTNTHGITSLASVTAAQYNQINAIVGAADRIFKANAIDSSSSGAQATAVQAMIQSTLPSALQGLGGPMPTDMAGANTLAGLMALELKDQGVSGTGFGNNNFGANTIQQYFFNATPAQLVAAAQAALKSSAFTTGDNAATLQANLVTNTLSGVFRDAKQYTESMNNLSGLLNSSNTPSSILKMAVANALGVQSVNGMLNSQNQDGVASKNGVLTNANIATIQNALNKMNTAQQPLTVYNDAEAANTPVGATARLITQMITNNSSAQANLNLLSGNGIATNSSASDYQQQANIVISDQAQLMAENNSYTLGGILDALKVLAQNEFVDTGNSSVGNANAAVQAIYQEIIASPTINYNTASNNLNNLINQLQNLQTSLIDQLAGMAGVAGVGGAAGGAQVANVQAEVAPQHASFEVVGKGFGTNPSGSTATRSSVSGLIQQVNQALVYAKAAQAKLNTFLKSNGYGTYTASHTPMVPMNSNGNMYGIDVQFGYKQFFGKKKRWGLRYYANFSYQHGTFMNSNAAELDNFVYGAGVDALYNFYESKDGKYTTGLFAGLMLDGSSWAVKGQSYYTYLMNYDNSHGGHAVMNTSYFQIPLNLGFRTNVNRHNGFEIGLRIPLATNYYFKGVNADGMKTDIAYKRNVSVYFNYVYNF